MNRPISFLFLIVAAAFPLAGCMAQNGPPQTRAINASRPTGIRQVVRDCAGCPELIRVEGVGDDGQALLVGRFELLWQEYYQSMVEANCPAPSNLDGTLVESNPGLEDRYPITSIRPTDIHCYLSWLSKKSGKTFRIPNEREWIRIAKLSGVEKADTVRNYPRSRAFLRDPSSPFLGLSAKELNAMAPVNSERRQAVRTGAIAPVGLKEEDKAGLYDIIGNLPEMIADFPSDVPPTLLGRNTIVAKGAGLGSLDLDLSLLAGNERFFSEFRINSVGYRVLREE